jgi:hypothetical protein
MNKIALLNDDFRRTFRGGKVMMTSGVDELPDCVKVSRITHFEGRVIALFHGLPAGISGAL